MRVFRWHAIDDFLTCRKKFENRWLKNLEPIEAPKALRVGKAVHSVIERSLKERADSSVLTSVLKEHELVEGLEAHQAQECAETALELIASTPIEPLSDKHGLLVERPFQVQLLDSYTTYRGRIDLVANVARKGPYVVDFKTYSMSADTLYMDFKMKRQMWSYVLALSKLGLECVGYAVVLLKKPRSLSTESEHTLFIYNLTKEELSEFEQELLLILSDIRQAIEDNALYKNTSACVQQYGACPYLELCSLGSSGLLQEVQEEEDTSPLIEF